MDATEMLIRERITNLTAEYNRAKGTNYPVPNMLFDLRGRTAGWAISRTYTIRFNLPLARENLDAFLARTVPHELAHLFCHLKYGVNCGHGFRWKMMMEHDFHAESTRCHSYNTANHRARSTTRHHYKCGCSLMLNIGPKHHHQINEGRKMWCARCKTVLTPAHYVDSFVKEATIHA